MLCVMQQQEIKQNEEEEEEWRENKMQAHRQYVMERELPRREERDASHEIETILLLVVWRTIEVH